MATLRSIGVGALAAVTAILLHQTLPPFGVALGLIGSFIAIWSIGRRYGERRYKLAAAIAWLVVVGRAGTFGAGQELLLQADGVGSTLLLLGTATIAAAVLARN